MAMSPLSKSIYNTLIGTGGKIVFELENELLIKMSIREEFPNGDVKKVDAFLHLENLHIDDDIGIRVTLEQMRDTWYHEFGKVEVEP